MQITERPAINRIHFRRSTKSGLRLVSLFVMLMLCTGQLIAQEILPRVSVATRSDGLGYVMRLHFTSSPDSFKVFQPTNDKIQLAIYKSGINPENIQFPDPGRVFLGIKPNSFPGGIGFDIQLSENHYFIANAYPDVNRNHLLLGLTEASSRDIEILTEGMNPIVWNHHEDEPEPETWTTGGELSAVDSLGTDFPEDSSFTPLPEVIPSNNRSGRRLNTIIIDPGHGGHDPGASGPAGTREKDLVLTVAKRLGAYINEFLPDVNVVYTRIDDTFVDLHERGRIANRAQGDLFISIHANGSTARSAYGAEVFFLGVARTESALEVMKLENSVIALEDPATRTRELTEEELILYELTNVGYMATSERIASKMDMQFSQRAGRRSRGVKQAGFIVLYQASMPAVLVELGFISNPQEERYMRTESGQAILASAMFRAIRDYKVAIEATN